MSMQKKLKIRGLAMLIPFFVLLTVIFSPVFPGKVNGLVFMDNLFNKISKGSVYFIPDSIESAKKAVGKTVEVKITAADEEQAGRYAALLKGGGATVTENGLELSIQGDMGNFLQSSLADAEEMYRNNGSAIADKYGFDERQAMYDWWKLYGSMSSDLTDQKKFKEAKTLANVRKKALEPAYNYYGIDSGSYKDYLVPIVASLAFYVIYTLWYGFGIMYLFEGLGLRIEH